MICGEFHNKGGRIAGERFGLFKDKAGHNDRCHAHEIRRGRHPGAAAKEGTGNHGDDGHFRTAGNKTGGHDGHFTVAVLFDGAARHDARHAASGGHQHGNETLAG